MPPLKKRWSASGGIDSGSFDEGFFQEILIRFVKSRALTDAVLQNLSKIQDSGDAGFLVDSLGKIDQIRF